MDPSSLQLKLCFSLIIQSAGRELRLLFVSLFLCEEKTGMKTQDSINVLSERLFDDCFFASPSKSLIYVHLLLFVVS